MHVKVDVLLLPDMFENLRIISKIYNHWIWHCWDNNKKLNQRVIGKATLKKCEKDFKCYRNLSED